MGPWTEVAPGRWSAALPADAPLPKTLRIGSTRAPQARFPSDKKTGKAEWLFVSSVNHVANVSSAFEVAVQNPADNVAKANYHSWGNNTPGALVAYIFPSQSWVGLRVAATPIAGAGGRFMLDCPDGNAGLVKGNRIAFAGAREILDSAAAARSGVWAVSGRDVHVLGAAAPADVWIPVHPSVVQFESKTMGAMTNITFTDADFVASGVQTGFNDKITDKGCPHDGAVLISNSSNISLHECGFAGLGGGGVIVGNSSAHISVLDSNFSSMGQSGVMFVGNDTTQPHDSLVSGNTMVGIGTMLASAGGVVISSGRRITVAHNNISECSRWGVAVRSNGNAGSEFNVVEGNRIVKTGLLTADFGAISFIDHDGGRAQGNVVRGNCVRDVRGQRDQAFHGNDAGLLLSFWGRALYLDDRTSNVEISHNVFADTSHSAIFFHSGSNNTAFNNVIVNSTLNRGSTPGPQLLFKHITHGAPKPPMKDNVLFRNVIWTPRDSAEPRPGEVPIMEGSSQGAESVAAGGGTHSNWYYRRGAPIAKDTATLFFHNTWSQWANEKTGRGNGSHINKDPQFEDAEGGNWNLADGSPLKAAIGWADLPMPIC
jgi:hypothetical protein